MAKLGRPFTYQSEEERPVTVSLRIPRDLHDRMSRYAARHRQNITELLLDGLRWRLEQDDPREQFTRDLLYYYNTVLQELVKPAHLLDALIPFDEDMAAFPATNAEPALDISNYYNTVIQEPEQPLPELGAQLQEYDNTVIQQKVSTKRSGRPATMREPIINLLRSHPEGLTAEQIRGLLNATKPIGDTLQGMRRSHLVRTEGSGREMRYFLAGSTEKGKGQ
jgi:hypothetical protein